MIDVQRPRAAGHTRRPRRHVPTVYNIWRCVSMTKRWLSLVLVLTLLSTLFTGVAYAKVEYPASFSGATTHTLTAGVANTVTLGTIDCKASNVASALVKQWGTHGVGVAFKTGSGDKDWVNVPSTVRLDAIDDTEVIWEAKYTPKMLPSGVNYEIKIQDAVADFTVPTGYEDNEIKVTVTGSNLGSYTIENNYWIDVDYGMINVGGTAHAVLKYDETSIAQGVTWKSDDLTVATVDETGKITGVSLGDATITATTESGVTEETRIWVAQQVMTPEISFKNEDDDSGAVTVTITSKTEDATIYYTVGRGYEPADPSETEADTIRYRGPFTLTDTDYYTIKARAYKDGMTPSNIAAEEVEVYYEEPDEKIIVTPATASIYGRGSVQFSASVLPETAIQDVQWIIDCEDAYATIDDNGVVTSTGKMLDGKDYFDVKVEAHLEGWTNVECGTATVRIHKVDPTGVDYEASEITIPKGESRTFAATVAPAHASSYALTLDAYGTSTISGLTIGNPVVDSVTGQHTWTLSVGDAAKVGEYQLWVVATGTNVGRTVKLHIVEPSAKAPVPVFSPGATTFTDEGKQVVITSPNGTNLVVLVNGKEQTVTSNTFTYDVDKSLADGGSVTITAYSEADGKKYTIDSDSVANVYNKDLVVKDIELDLPEKGDTAFITGKSNGPQVRVTLTPAAASKDKVTLSSSDPNVFTVEYDDDEGTATLTGVNPGTARLIATDGKITRYMPVEVSWAGVDYIEVKNGSTVVNPGVTVQVLQTQYVKLGATAYGYNRYEGEVYGPYKSSDQTFTWTSNNPAVATVDSTGKVIALKPGTATITVTEPKSQVETRVTINVPGDDVKTVATPVFSPAPKTEAWTAAQTIMVSSATEGSTLYYTLNGNYPTTSSAQVPATGIVLDGTEKVTVRVLAVKDGMNEATAEATYDFNIHLNKVSLPATQALRVGETLQMKPTLTPANASVYSTRWTVTGLDGKVTTLASIDNNGVLTAKDEGMVLVTVIVTDKDYHALTTTSVVTITKQPVTSLTVLPASVTLSIGESQQFSYVATRETAKATRGTWLSSDTKVATVDNNGYVRAVGAGVATISVTVDDKVGTATVTVLADPTIVPAKPVQAVTYTATPANKTYNALANGSLSVQVGSLTPGAGETLEQLFYYYTVKVTPTATLTAVDSSANFVVAKDGKVYLNVSDVGTADFFFDYTVSLEKKTDRLGVADQAIGINGANVNSNIVHIVTTPTDINFIPTAVEDVVVAGGGTATRTLGTIGNYADFTATGVAVTAAANVSADGVAATAMIDSTGHVSVALEGLKTGMYTVNVTLTASGCASVTTNTVNVTVTSDKEDPVPPTPTEKALVVTATSGAYTGVKGVTQLLKNDGTATFTVTGLSNGVTVTGWKSSKPGYVAIASCDSTSATVSLRKAGSSVITATLSDGSKLTMKVNVNKGSFADPDNITLQTKPGNKWVDVTAEGITVVPKKSGQKSVPSRLNASDDGKIVIQDVEFSNGTIASRDGDNPSPIKVKKRSISDGETTTLTITANGAKFSVVIKVDSGAKDVYLEDVIAEIEEIIELEAE